MSLRSLNKAQMKAKNVLFKMILQLALENGNKYPYSEN